MAGVYFCIGWQLGGEHVKRGHHVCIAAPFEIGTADAHTEKCVATEGDMFISIVKDDTAGRMARGVKNLPGMGTEGNIVAIGEITVNGRHIQMDGNAQDLAGLLFHIFHEETVVLMGLGLQTESPEDIAVAHAVVEVAVGAEQMTRRQVVLLDIVDDGLAFFRIICPTIDDDTVARLVADHIAVLSEHITEEAFDGKHGRYI